MGRALSEAPAAHATLPLASLRAQKARPSGVLESRAALPLPLLARRPWPCPICYGSDDVAGGRLGVATPWNGAAGVGEARVLLADLKVVAQGLTLKE